MFDTACDFQPDENGYVRRPEQAGAAGKSQSPWDGDDFWGIGAIGREENTGMLLTYCRSSAIAVIGTIEALRQVCGALPPLTVSNL